MSENKNKMLQKLHFDDVSIRVTGNQLLGWSSHTLKGPPAQHLLLGSPSGQLLLQTS